MEQPRCVTEYYITPSLHTHGARHSHTRRTASTRLLACSLARAAGGASDTHELAGVALGSARMKSWGAPGLQGTPLCTSVELPRGVCLTHVAYQVALHLQ